MILWPSFWINLNHRQINFTSIVVLKRCVWLNFTRTINDSNSGILVATIKVAKSDFQIKIICSRNDVSPVAYPRYKIVGKWKLVVMVLFDSLHQISSVGTKFSSSEWHQLGMLITPPDHFLVFIRGKKWSDVKTTNLTRNKTFQQFHSAFLPQFYKKNYLKMIFIFSLQILYILNEFIA